MRGRPCRWMPGGWERNRRCLMLSKIQYPNTNGKRSKGTLVQVRLLRTDSAREIPDVRAFCVSNSYHKV